MEIKDKADLIAIIKGLQEGQESINTSLAELSKGNESDSNNETDTSNNDTDKEDTGEDDMPIDELHELLHD